MEALTAISLFLGSAAALVAIANGLQELERRKMFKKRKEESHNQPSAH